MDGGVVMGQRPLGRVRLAAIGLTALEILLSRVRDLVNF